MVEKIIEAHEQDLKEAGLPDSDEIKNKYVRANVYMATEDGEQVVVASLSLFKNSKLFQQLENVAIKKYSGESYENIKERIIKGVEKLLKKKGFSLELVKNTLIADDELDDII